MKKRITVLLVLLFSFTFMLFASGSKESSAGATSSSDMLDANGRFTTPHSISVEIYDRGNTKGTKPEDNYWTDFIKKGMKEKYNVDVTFVPVPRWTEVENLNNLLAAGTAPDVCVTYSLPTIQTYANMGGVTDLAPLLDEYKDKLPNMWNLLGDKNIYYDIDPETKSLWNIEAIRVPTTSVSTFVREDWLKKLNLEKPTNLEEFETMLKAFRDNADLLLGKDASKMVPFSLNVDVGWRIGTLADSYIPNAITDEEAFINGYDDRHLLFPGFKEAVRKVNDWYNQGLVWKDFALYPDGDKTEDNMIKAGYVGAFIHNWDYPYRDGGEGVQGSMSKIVGSDAAFVAVDTFKNDAGLYRKYLPDSIDRKVFFPATNKEPLASLFYLEWMSTLENRRYLQIGDENVNHTVMENGAIAAKDATGTEKVMNVVQNIDYTIVINGLDLGDDELNNKSRALNYPGIDSFYTETSMEINQNDARIFNHYNVGKVDAEEGLDTALKEKRNNLLAQSVVAPSAQFDKIWDAGFQDYLKSGGQAIIDERQEKLNKYY